MPVPFQSIAALAKVNLALHVVGRRDDGYHWLDSLVAFVNVGEWVAVTSADVWCLSATGPFAAALPPAEGDNLALRAAMAAAAALKLEGSYVVELHKALPVASGIGGGSADAAAAIRAVEAFAGRALSEPARSALALSLGADVPICLGRAGEGARSARMSGIGEKIEPWGPLPNVGVVLANPLVAVPTEAVFRALAGHFGSAMAPPTTPHDLTDLVALLAPLRNDLQEPASALVPEIATLIAALDACGEVTLARMSGSGATCFGLTTDREQADAVARRLQAQYPLWWFVAGVVE